MSRTNMVKPVSAIQDLEAFRRSHSWYKAGMCKLALVPVVDSHHRNDRYFSNDDGKLHWYMHHSFFVLDLIEDPICRRIIENNTILVDGTKIEHDTKYYYGLMEHITDKIWKELEQINFKNFKVDYFQS
jgi:protein-tyrosine phosphatase